MYSNDNIINNLCLTVINDGNGDQCGYSYDQRVSFAKHGLTKYRHACRNADSWNCCHEGKSATRQQVFTAADIVQEYYRQHVLESA